MMADGQLAAAVRAKIEKLQAELAAKVEANLSGEILQSRTGALKASIRTALGGDDDHPTLSLASEGVPYAAILEYGGETAPHEIVPVKAKALAFAGAGGMIFARRVRHPGSVIAPRAYLGGALAALQEDMTADLKAAVLSELGAD